MNQISSECDKNFIMKFEIISECWLATVFLVKSFMDNWMRERESFSKRYEGGGGVEECLTMNDERGRVWTTKRVSLRFCVTPFHPSVV